MDSRFHRNPGCPIKNLGHDEKYSSQELTPGELLILTLFWFKFASGLHLQVFISNIYATDGCAVQLQRLEGDEGGPLFI
jgi:hypothetical protein